MEHHGSTAVRPGERDIADELTSKGVALSIGGVYDPNDPVGRLLFNVLSVVTEFESDPIRLRSGRNGGREGGTPAIY